VFAFETCNQNTEKTKGLVKMYYKSFAGEKFPELTAENTKLKIKEFVQGILLS
jgi:hypothetical protein